MTLTELTLTELRILFPSRVRVINPERGTGTVTGSALMPSGPLVYVTWDTERDTTKDGVSVAWREAVVPSAIVVLPC